MSSAGWSGQIAVAAAQRSQAGLRLGYHALFCLQPVSQWTRNCGCLCCCCCGEGGRFHPVLVLSVAWEGWESEGRPGARSRVENSWMLPLRPQRMFRAHIRCDQWCHLFCLGRNEIPLITQWTLGVFKGSQYFWSDKQINTFNALVCCVHTWEIGLA